MISSKFLFNETNHLFAHSYIKELSLSNGVILPTDITLTGKKVKLATIVEGDPKAPFSIATTPRCRGGRYSIPWIAPLYP